MASYPSTLLTSGKKLVSSKSGLRMLCVNDAEKSAFEINEPNWQVDCEQPVCNKCSKKFTFKIRRHHCRRCGKIFCSDCCKNKLALPRLSFVDPQLVCTDCLHVAKKEISLYENLVPILTKGAEFLAKENQSVFCKLDVKSLRELVFNCLSPDGYLEGVLLREIESFQCLTDPLEQNVDGVGLVGVNIKYKSGVELKTLKLMVPNSIINRKDAVTFLLTLQKVVRLIFDSS
ncbi:zinc finger FYVE domain-containing protein 21 isoform X1 [Hydra vulgaris]|uniref:Zinc finger FYVE domain-containing protein 21 n=1 Tax=Hydra vulgaris TaxID=6087 RepID=T2M754_HYDVU|nr:zinc finger FYVE domain-containing protein 21 [Hydra vulgaris]